MILSRPRTSRFRQRGFSMVEFLMTAFVVAIGLLGLAMLQVMSMRSARGSRNLNTAVLLAERMMDQIEMEGRLSWLNLTDANSTGTLTQLQCLNKAAFFQGFDVDGQPTTAAPVAAKPTNLPYILTATRTQVATTGVGRISDYAVTIEFLDIVDQSGTPITRRVVLTRRVLHA